MENEASSKREAKPITVVFGENLRAIRKKRGLTLQQLCVRLEDIGHPIGVAGIGKLENAQRAGIDVADLFAFGIALNASPAFLLRPESGVDMMLTPEVPAAGLFFREWIRGESALPVRDGEDQDEKQKEFIDLADFPERLKHALAGDRTVDQVERLLSAVKSGIVGWPADRTTPAEYSEYLRTQLELTTKHVELLAEEISDAGFPGVGGRKHDGSR
jgi:transcriptional regulator with XRE-family HTH domain